MPIKCTNGQKIFNNNDCISLGRISLVSTFDGTTSYIKALFFRFLPEQVGRKRWTGQGMTANPQNLQDDWNEPGVGFVGCFWCWSSQWVFCLIFIILRHAETFSSFPLRFCMLAFSLPHQFLPASAHQRILQCCGSAIRQCLGGPGGRQAGTKLTSLQHGQLLLFCSKWKTGFGKLDCKTNSS